LNGSTGRQCAVGLDKDILGQVISLLTVAYQPVHKISQWGLKAREDILEVFNPDCWSCLLCCGCRPLVWSIIQESRDRNGREGRRPRRGSRFSGGRQLTGWWRRCLACRRSPPLRCPPAPGRLGFRFWHARWLRLEIIGNSGRTAPAFARASRAIWTIETNGWFHWLHRCIRWEKGDAHAPAEERCPGRVSAGKIYPQVATYLPVYAMHAEVTARCPTIFPIQPLPAVISSDESPHACNLCAIFYVV
jgi:hypothetical protein